MGAERTHSLKKAQERRETIIENERYQNERSKQKEEERNGFIAIDVFQCMYHQVGAAHKQRQKSVVRNGAQQCSVVLCNDTNNDIIQMLPFRMTQVELPGNSFVSVVYSIPLGGTQDL